MLAVEWAVIFGFLAFCFLVTLIVVVIERDKADEDRDQYKRLYELALSRKQYLDERVDSLTGQKIRLIDCMNRSTQLLCHMHTEIDELNEDRDLLLEELVIISDEYFTLNKERIRNS